MIEMRYAEIKAQTEC